MKHSLKISGILVVTTLFCGFAAHAAPANNIGYQTPILAQTKNADLANKRLRDWDTRIINTTDYTLRDATQSKDDKGWLTNLHAHEIDAHSDMLAFQYQANFLGQLSQDMQYLVFNGEEPIGVCVFHAGLGSFVASPDFTGSECQLTNGDVVHVNPGYRILNDTYDVKYSLAKEKQFSRLFVFGDSLSDNGNLYRMDGGIIPSTPPYYRGHFADGKIWAEYLQEAFGMSDDQLQDYAVGNAHSDPASNIFFPLSYQVTEYKMLNFTGDSAALYAIWIGANDLLNINDDLEGSVSNVLSHINESIRSLVDHGARTFLLPNLPDLGLTPRAITRDQDAGHHDYSQKMHAATVLYNQRLAAMVHLLQQELNITIHTFDVYETMDNIVQDPSAFGMTNITEACNPNGFVGNDLPVCEHPEQYLFWDELHPTTAAHQKISKMVFAQLSGTEA